MLKLIKKCDNKCKFLFDLFPNLYTLQTITSLYDMLHGRISQSDGEVER